MLDYSYITIEDAIKLHQQTIINSGGGAMGHFDLGRLESVLQNIQNNEYYPSFADKISHLFFCVCEFHCFEDGNKRLAITLSAQFLLINGYMSVAKTFFTIMENISYHVAAGKISKELLLRIINEVLKGTYEENEELRVEILNAII